MGVLEFFGTLIRNEITSSAFQSEFAKQLQINHLLLDFNSIIHVQSQKVAGDINTFMRQVLTNAYNHRSLQTDVLQDIYVLYKMEPIPSDVTAAEDIIKIFHEFFNEDLVDKLVITAVINTVLSIIRTYCYNKDIRTLMLAIDGVPSKGKLIEQRQRRYMSAIMETYKGKLLHKYKDYLLTQPDYVYLATKHKIEFFRGKITPGTGFMQKLSDYLHNHKVQSKLKTNRPQMSIVISDMHEVGEGEKKIINYINKFLPGTPDTVVVYSPDADMILLNMLLPVEHIYMLRHNQQTSTPNNMIYDLIDIRMLKANIGYYINGTTENFDVDRISRDIVCLSTLFGNDFVPKIETINVKSGFHSIMDAYLKTLVLHREQKYYLVSGSTPYKMNLSFLKSIIAELVHTENDFIKHNRLYNEYVRLGQIKHVFDYVEISRENLVSTYQQFRAEYGQLQNLIRNRGNLFYFETHDQFMNSLKRSLNIIIDGSVVNTSKLTNKEMIQLLRKYFRINREFPRPNINLDTESHSIKDRRFKNRIRDKKFNAYDTEAYQFDNMLDQYYDKFNCKKLDLSETGIGTYYKTYFGVDNVILDGDLSAAATEVMYQYLQGLVWVFEYYFNDKTYVNWWYYEPDRAPLLRHLSMFLNQITKGFLNQITDKLSTYKVPKLQSYFNPIEQLIYVSPLTSSTLKVLPSNYRDYLKNNTNPFLATFFPDPNVITNQLWSGKLVVDCHSIPYLNKCFVHQVSKPTKADDLLFLKALRKVKPTAVSIRRSASREPDY